MTIGGAVNNSDFPKEKSCGLPWRERGFKTKGEALADPKVRGSIFRQWEAIGNGRQGFGLPDTCAYFRAQITSPGNNKIRAVWGIPLDVIVEEFRFFHPYIKWLENEDVPIGYHVEMATGGMAYINEMCRNFPNHKYLMVDYQEFDKSVPAWLIRDAFKIIFDSFDLTQVEDSEGKVWRVNPVRTKRRIRALVKYFINTPIRFPSGERFRKASGVPSGSMFTNIVDTIVNAIVMRYSIYHTTGHLPAAEMYLGDDSFIVSEVIMNLTAISNVAKEKFGMTVHPDKSYLTMNPSNVQFLGYYNRNGLPYKGHSYLLASFIYPEREVKDNIVRVSRAIGQMWSTLHSGMAYKWIKMVDHMLMTFEIDLKDVERYIQSHPSYFRYLRMIGIPVNEIGMPDLLCDVVIRVDPRSVPKRPFVRKKKDIEDLYQRSILYNWDW